MNVCKHSITILIGVFLLYGSYYFNMTKAVDNERFQTFELISEQLVLDGMLANSSTPRLGHYTRPEIGKYNYLNAHELYEMNNRSGHFIEYTAQYGLQIRVFNFLVNQCGFSLKALKMLSSFLLACVIVGLAYSIRRHISRLAAGVFFLVLLTGPWVIIFSNNLYWVTFTWFLPMLVTFVLAPKLNQGKKWMFIMTICMFFAFLLKFLCGYEYITTIVLASLIPMVFLGIKTSDSYPKILLRTGAVFITSIAAFLIAIAMHSSSLKKSGYDSSSVIVNIINKRTASGSPDEVAKRIVSSSDPNETPERLMGGEEIIRKSLEASYLSVFVKYLHNEDMIPWLSLLRVSDSDNKKTRLIANHIKNFQWQSLMESENFGVILRLLPFILNKLFLITIITVSFYAAFRLPFCYFATLTLSFAAPVSWFIMAKAHSHAHTHMNYVLWYLFFVPFALITIAEFYRQKKKTGNSSPQV